jgi:hypothetical protein
MFSVENPRSKNVLLEGKSSGSQAAWRYKLLLLLSRMAGSSNGTTWCQIDEKWMMKSVPSENTPLAVYWVQWNPLVMTGGVMKRHGQSANDSTKQAKQVYSKISREGSTLRFPWRIIERISGCSHSPGQGQASTLLDTHE